MSATINVTCPKCKKAMKAPAAAQGKKIKCRNCEEVFPVAAQPAKAGAQAGTADEEWGIIKAYGVEGAKDRLRCPHCAWELDNDDDVVCLHCGYNLLTRQRMPQRVVESVNAGDYIAWHLPGALCWLVGFFFIGLIVALWTGVPDLTSVGMGWMQEWKWSRVYGTAIFAFIIFFLLKFAVRRNFIRRHPPEKEKRTKKKVE